MEVELKAIKDQVKTFYPDQQLDLSFIVDVETARRALFFAEQGLKVEYMIRVVKDEMEKRKAGWSTFKRLNYYEAYLRIAPSWLFRNGQKGESA